MSEDELQYSIVEYPLMKENPCEFTLYLLIRARSRLRGYCFTSNKGFMDFFNVSLNNIIRWKKSLEKRGYIKIEKGGGHSASKIYPLVDFVVGKFPIDTDVSTTKNSSTEISSTENSSTEISSTENSSTENSSSGVLKMGVQQYQFQYSSNINSNSNSNSICASTLQEHTQGTSESESEPNSKDKSDEEGEKKKGRKKRQKKSFVPPTLEDVKKYAIARGFTDVVLNGKDRSIATRFFDYYATGQWHDSNGKAVKNWKQKFLTWEKSEEKREPKRGGADNQVKSYSVNDDEELSELENNY